MKKLINIIKGWYYKVFQREQFLADTRLPICKACEHKKESKLGSTCGICGCILDAKTRVEDEYCELHKW